MSEHCARFENLQEIGDDRIYDALGELYDNMPYSIHPISFIRSGRTWRRMLDDCDFKIYAPDGDFSDATVVMILRRYGGILMTAYSSTERGLHRLKDALLRTHIIPWEDDLIITCLIPPVAKLFGEVLKLKRKGLIFKSVDTVFWLPRASALQWGPRIPVGLKAHRLTEEHAEKINTLWPHKTEGSVELIKDQIRGGVGVGLFKGEEMVSWSMVSFYGGMGLIHTDIKDRRCGFGRAVVRETARAMAQSGYDIHINVMGSNEGAIKFFKRIQFKELYKSTWYIGWRICPLNRITS